MNYMGGKQKQSKYIIPILNNFIEKHGIENYYEPFCGGFNVGAWVECEKLFASDLSPTLIALLSQAQSNPSQICTNPSKEKWNECKAKWYKLRQHQFKRLNSVPLAEIGALEWLASYHCGGFPSGYGLEDGRNLYNERLSNLLKQASSPSFQKTKFTCQSYKDVNFSPNSIVYVDAPTFGQKSYGVCNNFNFSFFYKWLKILSQNMPLFISEQYLPEDLGAKVVWEENKEKLFYLHHA